MEETHRKKTHNKENSTKANHGRQLTDNTESNRNQKKKYHEDCYTEHKLTERRTYHRAENNSENKTNPQSGDYNQSTNRREESPTDRHDRKVVKISTSRAEKVKIKRKPRVEDAKGHNKDTRHATCSKERNNRKGCRKYQRQHSEETATRTNCDEIQERKQRKRPSHRDEDHEVEKTQKRIEKVERRHLRGAKLKNDDNNDDNYHRKCYSDSELEQTRSHVHTQHADTKSRKADSTGDERAVHEHSHKKLRQETRKICNRRSTKTRGQRRYNEEDDEEIAATEGCDQSTIRGKLIRVLFKRVKDLLKETEQLRDERKEFTTQIEELSRQVAGLRMKEEEHVTSELKIKESLNAIGNEVDITSKGKHITSFILFYLPCRSIPAGKIAKK